MFEFLRTTLVCATFMKKRKKRGKEGRRKGRGVNQYLATSCFEFLLIPTL